MSMRLRRPTLQVFLTSLVRRALSDTDLTWFKANSSTVPLSALASTGRRNIPAFSTSSQPISARQELRLKEQSEARLRDISRNLPAGLDSASPPEKSRSLPEENFSSSSRAPISGRTLPMRARHTSSYSEDRESGVEEVQNYPRPHARSQIRTPPSRSSDSDQEVRHSSKRGPTSPQNRSPFIAAPVSPIGPYQSQLREYQQSSRPREGFVESDSDSDDDRGQDERSSFSQSKSNPFGDFVATDTENSRRVSEVRRGQIGRMDRSRVAGGRRGNSLDSPKPSELDVSEDERYFKSRKGTSLSQNQGEGRSRNPGSSNNTRSFDSSSESDSDSRTFNTRAQPPEPRRQTSLEFEKSKVRQDRRPPAAKVGRRAARRMKGEGR